MKNLKLAVLIFVIGLSVSSTYAQQKLRGKVVEIVDGRTVVIELFTSHKITAQLQFIEVPEPEQPLFQIVREHLRKLVLGREGEFQPFRLLNSMSVGRLHVNGTDVSQQMLRDGAAWYAVLEKSAQNAAESDIYQKTEAQAKSEKRGVWAITNMKPAWEFRREKNSYSPPKIEEIIAGSSTSKNEPPQKPNPTKQTSTNQALSKLPTEMWQSDTSFHSHPDLMLEYDPVKNKSLLHTPLMFLPLTGGQISGRISIFVSYHFNGQTVEKGGDKFVFAIRCIAGFLRNKKILIYADKKILRTGKPILSLGLDKETESLYYQFDRKTLGTLADSDEATIRLDSFEARVDRNTLKMIKRMLDKTG